MGKYKRKRYVTSNSDHVRTKAEVKEIPVQEPGKILTSDHSPHKNKVLKHSFFGRYFGNLGKLKEDAERERKCKYGAENKKLFSKLESSKFPIVSVKPLSNKVIKDSNEDAETKGIEHKAKDNNKLDENDSSSSLKDKDDHDSTNEESNFSDILVEPLTNKVRDEERKVPRKRGRKRKSEQAVPTYENFKNLGCIKLEHDGERIDCKKAKRVSTEVSLEEMKDGESFRQTSDGCYAERRFQDCFDKQTQNYFGCDNESTHTEIETMLHTNPGVGSFVHELSGLQNDEEIDPYQQSVTEIIKTIYKCSLCKYESKVRAHAKAHSLTHANFKLYKCSECNYKTNRKDKIRMHLTKIHKFDSEDVSESTYITTQDVDAAKEVSFCQSIKEVDAKVFQCRICCYQTENQPSIERHLAIHSEIEVGLYKAFECKKETPVLKKKSGDVFDRFYKTIKKFEIKTEAGSHSAGKRTSIFRCSVCNYQTIKIDRAKRHSLTHSDIKLFKCPKCDFDTNRSENIRNHLNSVHGLETIQTSEGSYISSKVHDRSSGSLESGPKTSASIFKCCFCDFQTDFQMDAEKHFAAHFNSELNLFDISDCGPVVGLGNLLQSHNFKLLETKYTEVVERCYETISEIRITDTCNQAITDKKSLFKCPACDYETTNKSHAKRHALRHSNKKPFKCYLCDYACNRKDKLKIHTMRHAEKKAKRGRKPYKATIDHSSSIAGVSRNVDEAFTNFDVASEFQLDTHSDVFDDDIFQSTCNFEANEGTYATNPIPYPDLKYDCPAETSAKSFTSDNFLERETNGECEPVSARIFAELLKCAKYDFQSYREPDPSPLDVNEKSNDNDYIYESACKLFRCLECSFQTHEIGTFQEHSKTHLDLNQFTCSQCDFETTSEIGLQRHLKSCAPNYSPTKSKSPKRKIFQCPECDHQFKYKKVWNKHLKTHVKIEPKESSILTCSKCDFETSILENLHSHMKTHEKPQLFKCSNCTYETKYKFALLKHAPACMRNIQKSVEAYHLQPDPNCSFEKTDTFSKYDEGIESNSDFENDLESEMPSNMRVLKCAECNFQTYVRSRLKKHLRVHVNELTNEGNSDYLVEPSECSCGSCADNSSSSHLGLHSSAQELFKCSECSYVTHKQGYLKMHALVH